MTSSMPAHMTPMIQPLESRMHLSGTKPVPPTLATSYSGTVASFLYTSQPFTVSLVSQIKTKVILTLQIPAQTVGNFTIPSFPLVVKGTLTPNGVIKLAGKISQNLGLSKPVSFAFGFTGTVTADGASISGNGTTSAKAPFFSITKLPETVALAKVSVMQG